MTIDQSQSDHVVDDAIGAGVAPAGAHWTDIDRLREAAPLLLEHRRARATGC